MDAILKLIVNELCTTIVTWQAAQPLYNENQYGCEFHWLPGNLFDTIRNAFSILYLDFQYASVRLNDLNDLAIKMMQSQPSDLFFTIVTLTNCVTQFDFEVTWSGYLGCNGRTFY